MNIYDEAIKELHEFSNYNGIDFEIPCKALERAKKVEELKVYQERYIHKLSYGRRSPYDKKYHLEKIAQLKQELEELK